MCRRHRRTGPHRHLKDQRARAGRCCGGAVRAAPVPPDGREGCLELNTGQSPTAPIGGAWAARPDADGPRVQTWLQTWRLCTYVHRTERRVTYSALLPLLTRCSSRMSRKPMPGYSDPRDDELGASLLNSGMDSAPQLASGLNSSLPTIQGEPSSAASAAGPGVSSQWTALSSMAAEQMDPAPQLASGLNSSLGLPTIQAAGGGGSETSRLLPGGTASATTGAATATGIDPNVSVEADPEVGRPTRQQQFVVCFQGGAVLRKGVEMTSPKTGTVLPAGAKITAIATRTLPSGVVRVQCTKGWVSTAAGDGTPLLTEVAAKARRGEPSSAASAAGPGVSSQWTALSSMAAEQQLKPWTEGAVGHFY
eukprot:COSAG06_NODE_9791_length_1815_cov_3.026224_1_plen_365_part_00